MHTHSHTHTELHTLTGLPEPPHPESTCGPCGPSGGLKLRKITVCLVTDQSYCLRISLIPHLPLPPSLPQTSNSLFIECLLYTKNLT